MILTSSVDLTSVVTNISSYDPYTHTYLTFVSGYLVSMDQVSMCICRPDIYGCLSTRYLGISGDQISMSICDFFLPEGKTVAIFLIAAPVLYFFPESLLTIHNLFRPLGKAVANFLIAIPVLLFLSESLLTIHNLFRPLGKAVAIFLIAIPVL